MENILGKKVFELEPGDIFSCDEGFNWVKCIKVYEDPYPDGPIDWTITLSTGERIILDPDIHILLPVYPGELEQAKALKL